MSTSTNNKSASVRNRNRRKRQKNRRKANKVRNAPILPVAKSILHIAPCTRSYLKSIVDPFGTAEPVCIPDVIILPSFKYRCTAKGSLSTSGITGVGFAAFNPWTMLVNNHSWNTTGVDYPLVTSSVSYPLSTVRWFTGGLQAGVVGYNSNSFLDDTAITGGQNDPQIRLVSAGIKIRYTGSNFRNQGNVTLYRGVTNVPPTQPIPLDLLKNAALSQVLPVSRREEYLYYVPDNPQLLAYNPYAFFMPSTGSDDRHSYIIAVDGGDIEVPQTWVVECVANFEVIGKNFPATPSDGDAAGFAQALAAIPSRAPDGPPKSILSQTWNSFKNSFAEGTSYVASQVGSAIPNIASGMAANMASNYFGGARVAPSSPTIEWLH